MARQEDGAQITGATSSTLPVSLRVSAQDGTDVGAVRTSSSSAILSPRNLLLPTRTTSGRSSASSGGEVGQITSGSSHVSHISHRSSALSPSGVAPTTLEASLLRAVNVDKVLRCGVAAMRTQDARDENYKQSFQTDRIDDFLSHDWGSGGMAKLLCVCMTYNSRAALILSFIIGWVLAALQALDILPHPKPVHLFAPSDDERIAESRSYGYWAQLMGPLVFLAFFLLWQDIKCCLRLPIKRAFVDKFCIDQANPERKTAGIFGLAGFLRASNEFIILWSPRYFTRLWCTYEVASWLHLRKPLRAVSLMPLAQAQIVAAIFLSGYVGFIVLTLCFWFYPPAYFLVVVFSLWVASALSSHQARKAVKLLIALPDQLANFSVATAHCFCCDNNHRFNGEEIPCDREVVYTTITSWFGDANGSPVATDVALARFNRAVRSKFAPMVLKMAGPTQLPYQYALIPTWPFVFRACDVAAQPDWFGIALAHSGVAFFAGPIFYKTLMHTAILWERRVGKVRNKVLSYLVSAGLGTLNCFCLLAVWLPFDYAARLEPDWPVVVVFVFMGGICVALYREDLLNSARRVGVLRAARDSGMGKSTSEQQDYDDPGASTQIAVSESSAPADSGDVLPGGAASVVKKASDVSDVVSI